MNSQNTFLILWQKTWPVICGIILLSITFFSFITAFSESRPLISHAGSPFLSAQGTSLILNNQKFRFSGYNQYELNSGSNNLCGTSFTDAQVGSIFDQIKNGSRGSVIRTWFYQSFGGPTKGWTYFDRVIALAKQRGMFIIPTFADQWGNCEPGGNHYKSLVWYQTGYKLTNDGYPLSYYAYAQAVAQRYANEPTIAFWQLMNEAEASNSLGGTCNEPAAASALKGFADTVAGSVKSVDHNHLINLGTLASGQCGTQGGDFQTVHSGININITEYHDYHADNSSMPGDQYNGLALRIQQSANLNKPIFIGEAGIMANVQPNGTETGAATQSTLNQRANDFQAKMTAQFSKNIVGYLIWSKGFSSSSSYDVGPNDPTEGVMAKIGTLFSLYYPSSPTTPTPTLTVTPSNTVTPTPTATSVASVTHTLQLTVTVKVTQSALITNAVPSHPISTTVIKTPIPTTPTTAPSSNITTTPVPTIVSVLIVNTVQTPLANSSVSIKDKSGLIITSQTNQDGIIPILQGSTIQSVSYNGNVIPVGELILGASTNKVIIDLAKPTIFINTPQRSGFPIANFIIIVVTICLFIGMCVAVLIRNKKDNET